MGNIVNLILRELKIEDMDKYEYWTHPSREYHKYNGPYYKQTTEIEHVNNMKELRRKLLDGDNNVLGKKKVIVDYEANEIIGLVNWYWKSEETNWLEIGIVIFNENYWGQGIGYKGLKLWINMMFEERKNLVRIGLSTWSGNTRMMKLAEKLGLMKEAEYRNARIVDGNYYDSLSYGILKEEWKLL